MKMSYIKHKTSYIKYCNFFPILVKMTLFFPIRKAPAPFPKRGVRALGQGWTLLAQLGQLKTELGVKGLLSSHLWCPNDLTRLQDRLD